MAAFFRMAARNLLRHKRRSVLTGLIIGLGALMAVLAFSFSHSVGAGMIDSAIRSCTGNIQIHAPTGEQIEILNPSDEIPLLMDTDRITSMIVKNPMVAAVAPRLRFGGLLYKGTDEPNGVMLVGIDPIREPRITPKIKLIRGSYLTEPDGILLGQSMAKALHARIGQEYVIMTSNSDGVMNGFPFKVQGIVTHQGMGLFLDYMIYLDIHTARRLLYLDRNEAFELAVALKPEVNQSQAIESLRREFTTAGMKLRVDGWEKSLGIFYGILTGIRVMPGMMLVVILLVVSLGIINTVLMSVLERTREIGTMLALGTRPRQVLTVFLLETGILGAVAAGIGCIIGAGVIIWLGWTGIPATVDAMEFVLGGKRLFLSIDWPGLFISFGGTIVLSMVASYFPARRVTRIDPVQALRQN